MFYWEMTESLFLSLQVVLKNYEFLTYRRKLQVFIFF